MYKKKLPAIIGAVTLGAFSSMSVAQEAGVVSVGLIDIIPSLSIQAVYNDNIRSVEEDENPTSDTSVVIMPSVRAQIDNGVSGFAFDYSLTQREYLSESEENALDEAYGASFGWNVVGDHLVNLAVNRFNSQDPRSPDAASGVDSDELDEFEDTSLTFGYSFGAPDLLLGYALSMSQFGREYTTNRSLTSVNDRESDSLDARLNINLAERIQVNLTYGESDTDYDELGADNQSQDSEQQSYGLGIVWDFSEALDFAASYAEVDVDFESPDRDSSTSDRFNISSTWSPLDYTSFSLVLGRSIGQPDNNSSADGENLIEASTHQVGWRNAWNEVLSSNLNYALVENDFVGSTTNRVDTTKTISLGLNYQFRRWVAINFGLSESSRDGRNAASPNSDQMTATLGANFTL